jgi:hypothetical protein
MSYHSDKDLMQQFEEIVEGASIPMPEHSHVVAIKENPSADCRCYFCELQSTQS